MSPDKVISAVRKTHRAWACQGSRHTSWAAPQNKLLASIVDGISFVEIRGDGVDIGSGLRWSDTGFEMAHGLKDP